MNQQEYRNLISGKKTGITAASQRLLLSAASLCYAIPVAVRNFFYKRGILKTHKVGAVVISIGNITTGGTGKTPLVIWLCDFLQKKNIEPSVLTRGYKTGRKGIDIDEPAVILQNCPTTQVVVNPDRVAGAALAIEKFGSHVLIIDDGFQHRRLARDIDIVTIDAAEPFGFNKLLPAGLLREPVKSIARADAVVITRSDQVQAERLAEIEKKILEIKADLAIARVIHKPVSIHTPGGREISIDEIKGKKIFAFCGIGNPGGFFDTIKNCGAEIKGSEIFDDHHHYTEEEIRQISRKAIECGAEFTLTTEKDWTKITNLNIDKKGNFAFIRIRIDFTDGLEKLTHLINKTLAGKISKRQE